jgi:hypothetical protein
LFHHPDTATDGSAKVTHETLAPMLQRLGFGRIFVKIADGAGLKYGCAAFDACRGEAAVYAQHGVQPIAWSYNYPGDVAAQAEVLAIAARSGYAGYALDIEAEFDGKDTELRSLLQAFHDRRQQLYLDGDLAPGTFPIFVTTWGNPEYHRMNVGIIAEYADAHLPQVYLGEWSKDRESGAWTDRYLQDIASEIEKTRQEYDRLAAIKKPVYPILSIEAPNVTADHVNQFFRAGGPGTSLWQLPEGNDVQLSAWDSIFNQLQLPSVAPSVP